MAASDLAGRRRDLPTPRRHPAGDRARRRARRGHEPVEIASLLDERFRLLTGGRRSAVERHQTLRATVDWSYELLDDRERLVFDRLGVFAGTLRRRGGDGRRRGDGIERFDVLDALTDLVAKSMVVAERTDDGTTRYQLLETLRQYARERLDETGAADGWRRRHAEHYAAFADGGSACADPTRSCGGPADRRPRQPPGRGHLGARP